MNKLMNESVFAGWGRRIRTFATRSRAGCPTARLSPIQSKSGRFPGLLNDKLPSNLPQKTGKTGLLLQSQLPSSPNPTLISPLPTVINTPACRCGRPHFFSLFYYLRHGSRMPAFFFPIYRLIQRRLRPSPFLLRSGKIEAGGDSHAN